VIQGRRRGRVADSGSEPNMIAPGNILHDDLILEVARHLNLGFGSEVSELIFSRPQLFAERASRTLHCHVAYIGSNDFGEEIYRVGNAAV